MGAGGENIAPVPIEDNIKKLCPFVSNVMMVGDKRKFNTALVTPPLHLRRRTQTRPPHQPTSAPWYSRLLTRSTDSWQITLVCDGATGELAGTNKLTGAAKALDSACSTVRWRLDDNAR
jgi:hypothetical protein